MKKIVTSAIFIALLMCCSVQAQYTEHSSGNDPRIRERLGKHSGTDLDEDGVLTHTKAQIYKNTKEKEIEKRRAVRDRKQISPTYGDVRYGGHPRNLLDFYKANSNRPTPVVIYFHGGGFVTGDKSKFTEKWQCIKNGISVVSANYRFVRGENSAPFPGPMLDGARVIQFVRSKAMEWNLNPDKVILIGSSAGACLSVWLAVHDDLARPESEDPIERISTKVSGVIVYGAQTFLDPEEILKRMGGYVMVHPSLLSFYGIDSVDDFDTPEIRKKIYEASSINHVTPDDPPLQLRYSEKLSDIPVPSDKSAIHHPMFGKIMQDKYKELGLTCELVAADVREGRPELEFLKFCLQGFGTK